nr:hypothetical protein [Tanacetum cinerariifolium]
MRLNSVNYPKTRKLINELNLDEANNVKVYGYRRNEDLNQNVRNKEFIDAITIDIEVERVKNDVSKKKKYSSETKHDWLSIRTRGSPKVLYNLMKNLTPAQMKDIIDTRFGSMIGIASKEIPIKVGHFVVDNFNDDSMKLKLSNGVISITPKLVYKVLGVPLGGEDINRINRLRSEDVMTLEWHSQFSQRVDNVGQANQLLDTLMKTKIENLYWCKYVCMCLKMSKINWIRDGENSYYSGPLTALTLDSKMDKLDQKVTLLKLTVEDLEFEFSNSLVDHPNSSRLKDIKAKYNGIIQNTDLSDFAYAIKDNSIHHESQYGNNEEQMFVKGTHEEKEEEILKKDLIEVNVLKVIKADSMAEKSTQDDIGNEYRENEMIIINKDEDEFNVFNAESEIDVLKEDIKQDIKDASIRVQPKREPSITWYLKSHFQVRGSALNTYANTLSQTEVLTADTLFMMDDETDPM